MHYTKYILLSMIAISCLSFAASSEKLKKRYWKARYQAHFAFHRYIHQRNATNLAKLKEETKKGKRISKVINRQIESEREEGRMHKMAQMMLLLSLQSNQPLRPATEADFGLEQPRNKTNKECPQARKQKKTPKKWNPAKRVHQPRKKH